MRPIVFALVIPSTFAAWAASAQTSAAPGAQQPPNAQASTPGKPANLCGELLAFVRPPAPPAGSASASAPAPAGQGPAAAAQPSPDKATAVSAPAQNQSAPQPSPSGGAPQQSSSLSGPVTPSGPGASGPQGAAQPGGGGPPPASTDAAKAPASAAPPQQAAAAPAAPPAAPPPPKPTSAQIEKVEAAARDNNLQGCRDAAREMRKAGIVMPPPLLALAALDLKFFNRDQKQ